MTSNKEIARVIGYVSGSLWCIFAFTQMLIGFIHLGNCDASSTLPLYTGIHGLLNIMYGLGIIAFIKLGYKRIIGRAVFYSMWFVEGPLCLAGFGLYSIIAGCEKNCKKCGNDVLNGLVVTESIIFVMYCLLTISFIAYEAKTECKHCNKDDDSHTRRPRRNQIQSRNGDDGNTTDDDTRGTRGTHVHIQNQFNVQHMTNIPVPDTMIGYLPNVV